MKPNVGVFIFFSIICLSLAYKPVVLIHGIMTGSGSMEMISRRIQEVHKPKYINIYLLNSYNRKSSTIEFKICDAIYK